MIGCQNITTESGNHLVPQSNAWRDCRTTTANNCEVFDYLKSCEAVFNDMIPPNTTKEAKRLLLDVCSRHRDLTIMCWDYATEASGCP